MIKTKSIYREKQCSRCDGTGLITIGSYDVECAGCDGSGENTDED